MAYNYRRAEKAWLEWKQKEEEQLRLLGMDEDMIQNLHTYDWEQFKKERNFYRWNVSMDKLALCEVEDPKERIDNLDDLLDCIENTKLWAALRTVDLVTMRALVLHIKGYSYKQIAEMYGLQEMAVINRISRLRKKLKKFL